MSEAPTPPTPERRVFERLDLSGALFRDVDLTGAVMRGVELVDVDIDGEIQGLRINGVDVTDLVEAELDRRQPGRVTMRAEDPAQFREAWALLGRLWDGTVARARTLDPSLLHESVEGEWSFTQTLRHLAFATDAWVNRALLGDPRPWHPLDLPWDTMPPHPDVPWDRDARPSLEEVLALRASRRADVEAVLDTLTVESLAGQTTPVPGGGWPPSRSFGVKEVLRIVLNEEWHHRLYAERDLDALAMRSSRS